MPLWPSSVEEPRGFRCYLSPLSSFILFYRRVLITTDVWARGIDVQQVSLVINYDLPA